MRRITVVLLLGASWVAGCAGHPDKRTLAVLRGVEPDVVEVQVENGLDQAMHGYRRFLEEAPVSSLTPEAMRRLADLKLEKEFGIHGEAGAAELPAPAGAGLVSPPASPANLDPSDEVAVSDQEFEDRATSASYEMGALPAELELPDVRQVDTRGPREAIALYDDILAAYPNYEHNDRVLYQKARAFDELSEPDRAIAVIERLIARFPYSRHIDEVQFRRAEYFFTRKGFLDAEEAYGAVVEMGPGSEYYELALYKLGWTLYKQELHDEALDQYIALLDHKVSTGYDFDQTEDEAAERRISDTYRVISLSFSNLGGPEVVESYFEEKGSRSYEDRVYSQLGDFYLEKLRYHDAAASFRAFVRLHPLDPAAPHFGMRVVEVYETGGFPKLVLESKKEFATAYGLGADYWQYFSIDELPEVLGYLKDNLRDLAQHYHAVYQDEEYIEEKPANFDEALLWYRTYLASFPEASETPGIHYQLADLLFEDEGFGAAALEYEHTAYAYPEHEKAADAGYAAIYAHREHEKRVSEAERDAVRREAVSSTLRFVDTFPGHEHAAVVMGAAVDDLYTMKDFAFAIANAQRLIDEYPDAAPEVRRAAWNAMGHATFDLADYVAAEAAYTTVLEMTVLEDESRQGVVDNLAASIYKQGEQASVAEDHRAAADHFLRITKVAPLSTIRAGAEYDAGMALVQLEDWAAAATVFEGFRNSHPEHELHREATKQIALVYKKQGDVARAAEEYETVAREAEDPELRREALLTAGELFEEGGAPDRALAVYLDYVQQFPEPLELVAETRFKIAEIQHSLGEEKPRREQLRWIVDADRLAGAARTPRLRVLAARSALVLTEPTYQRFREVQLVQPFERNLKKKQKRMDAALAAYGRLVDYEVGEVTAAATFFIAEIYFDFSQALLSSERPAGLERSQLLDYEMVLEEEAFPFEEKAIGVHQKNLELMTSGTYNQWVDKSFGRLAELMPGRYAKFESSGGLIDSLEAYAYRSPVAPAPRAETTGLAPETEDVIESQDAHIESEAAFQPPAAPEAG